MALDKRVEQEFTIKCKGRDDNANEVLEEPVEAKVAVYQCIGDKTNISSTVECPHYLGNPGECKAKYCDGHAMCPYDFNLPSILDKYSELHNMYVEVLREVKEFADSSEAF